jgi:hypothetical protein
MALEDLTGTKYIDDLVATNPAAGDNVSEGDDHIRGIKNVLKTTFPSIDGAITATDTELNYVDGVTSNVQTQLNAKFATAGGTLTGAAQGSTDTDTTNTGSVTLDFSTNQNFVLTLTGNVTLANPTTETVGQSGFITFIQDGTGGRTVALGTDYETAGGAGLTLSSTASATDIVPYVVVASGRILLGTPQLAFA